MQPHDAAVRLWSLPIPGNDGVLERVVVPGVTMRDAIRARAELLRRKPAKKGATDGKS